MRHEPLPDIDRRLRQAFEPESLTVARVVAGAASGDATRPSRPGRLVPRLVWAGGVVLAMALATTVYRRAGLAVLPEPPVELLLSVSFTDDVLVVSAPDGSVDLCGPGARDDRPPDGSGIVLVEGDSR
jgi:hypothetical protein